jgi:hypothetical protein
LFQGGFVGSPKWFRRHFRAIPHILRTAAVRRKLTPGALKRSLATSLRAFDLLDHRVVEPAIEECLGATEQYAGPLI